MYKNKINGLPWIVVQEFNKVWMLSSKAAQGRRKKAPWWDWNLEISLSLKAWKSSEEQRRCGRIYLSEEWHKERYRESNIYTYITYI